MKVTVFYVGSSLLAPLRRAERDIRAQLKLDLRIATYNCTLPLADAEWPAVERDLAGSDVVFVIHVTDSENAARIGALLDRAGTRAHAVVVINCLRDLMERTRLGQRELFKAFRPEESHPALRMARKLFSWMGGHARSHSHRPERYLKLFSQVPAVLRFVPSAGPLGDIKRYLALYCYFLQPTEANIRSMVLYALKHYVPACGKGIKVAAPESRPVVGIYHPEARSLFESFDAYRKWYKRPLDPARAVGLLLVRPQIVSGARRHYDALIRALEAEGLPVIPVLSTFMDNREACRQFLTDPTDGSPRVGQVLSLAGFSFVGGPAMNDSQAAVEFLKAWNRPLRSAVALETQSIESWAESQIGLNPVQAAMQVAIPEIDGATEPLVYGGTASGGEEPQGIEDRCRRIARRLARWDRLRRLPRNEVRLALLIYCFPPNKGNLGTAAELDVFPSLWEILRRLQAGGYAVSVPPNADRLREMLLGGSEHLVNVAYRLSADEYYRLCPYVEEIEKEWGPAPGPINSQGRDILIHGLELGNVFLGVQPTFGYEGDPMRLLMAKGPAPHHGFMGLYTWLDRVFRADALVHVGTHGALEFMPGKQVGLSSGCWPDRLIGDFPNIYIYSVNNPSEGSIARRRSYAELISYLTPPIESAGLYKELASIKELLLAYRQAGEEKQREQLFAAIQEKAANSHLMAS